jgi:hypothetical protein
VGVGDPFTGAFEYDVDLLWFEIQHEDLLVGGDVLLSYQVGPYDESFPLEFILRPTQFFVWGNEFTGPSIDGGSPWLDDSGFLLVDDDGLVPVDPAWHRTFDLSDFERAALFLTGYGAGFGDPQAIADGDEFILRGDIDMDSLRLLIPEPNAALLMMIGMGMGWLALRGIRSR